MDVSERGTLSVSYGPDLQSLLEIAASLVAYKNDSSRYLSTSTLLFALALPAYVPEAGNRIASDDVSHFSLAFREVAGARFDEAWKRYFGIDIASIDLAGGRVDQLREMTTNCKALLALAATYPEKSGRETVTVADLIRALATQPQGRYSGILSQMGISFSEIFKKYERRAIDASIGVKEKADVKEYFEHDQPNNVDRLNFAMYAQAIANFLTSPETTGAISISIQAPWGVGKSSLMHQLRHLLDPDFKKKQDGSSLKTGSVLKFLNRMWRDAGEDDERNKLVLPAKQRWTVWFNAWQYESSEQVWAGLVDAIITQVSARLSLEQRELFLLRLNLARIDDGKVRQKLYDRLVAYWWAGARWILLAALAIPAALVKFGPSSDLKSVGTLTGAGLAASLMLWMGKSWAKVNAEPARFSLAEYVRVPDYAKSVGIIHQIHKDLKRIIAQLPRLDDPHGVAAPLVIFVDDLDRCAPGKVASIVEGINTFLASDQNAFIFVIGMDPQMVAAALEHAHKDVKNFLPKYEQNVPLGWRFMDKCIQLAFTIPPPRAADIENFVHGLTPFPQQANSFASKSGAPAVQIDASGLPVASGANGAEQTPSTQQPVAARSIVIESADVRVVMAGVIKDGMFSPRDIKRILNFVRFVLTLRQGRLNIGLAVPSLDAYERWIVLCIRWPDMARWLQWGSAAPQAAASASPSLGLVAHRLTLLEQAASHANDAANWTHNAAEKLGLPGDQVSWLADPDVRRFFMQEHERPIDARLAHGAGIGFY